MAVGDIGGPLTELVITCKTRAEGPVNIAKGDAVALVGPFTVSNEHYSRVFGQALAQATKNDEAIPVRVKGVSAFTYDNDAMCRWFCVYQAAAGVRMGNTPGAVAFTGDGFGKILAFNPDSKTVHVLH